MKKRKENTKKKIKKIIEFLGIRIIAFFIFNFPVIGYILACYVANNI